MLSTAAYLSDVEISYGVDSMTQAMQGMDPWTVTLITEHGSSPSPTSWDGATTEPSLKSPT